MDLKEFANPDSILRPAPFWAINSKIEPAEIARQMSDMIRVGLSGGFFHSRAGLVTDYLGEEWFACMEAAMEVARKEDGYLWLYDEDLWPSGNAGGQVAAMKDEYRATTLEAYLLAAGEPVPDFGEEKAVRCIYSIKSREGLQLKEFDSVPLDKAESAVGSERLVLVRAYDPKGGWWGGESYANLLHPEAMQQFIKMTHDVYAAKLGKEFGKRIPGIFTDEPNIRGGRKAIAWYEGLPELYRKWHGRDWWSDLPYIFFDGPESRKVRLLVHRTLLQQFIEAFTKPIFEWCEKHGIEHTGHVLGEEGHVSQIDCHYGGCMAHYRYQQAPGIDHLCRDIDSALFTGRQVSSAARQLGRKRVLTEIFGVSRHTNTFEDFKWLGDYDLVHGANFFVPHLTWYSATGKRKRDYPPVWNYQQTYWDDLRPLNDYFTRVAHALTRGKAKVDVLMLHSVEGATASRRIGVGTVGTVKDNARMTPVDVPNDDWNAVNYLDGQMRRAFDAILNAGYECDLGDEGYIEDLGSVKGANFIIGEMSYKLVVVPPAITWRPKTFELLKKFVANGGKVLVLGEIPSELDCEDAKSQWVEFVSGPNVKTVACSGREVQQAVDELAPSSFTLRGTDGEAVPLTYLHHRVDGDQEIFFIVNSDRNNVRDYVLTLKGAKGKSVTQWDPVEGTCEAVDLPELGDDLRCEFSLPQCGSMLLTVGGKQEGSEPQEADYEGNACEVDIIGRGAELDFSRLNPNVLVMDRLSVSYDGGKTFDAEDLDHRVRRSIAKHFGTSDSLEWQPWVSIRKKLYDGKGGSIVLRYKFASDLDKPRSWVVIENIWKGELFVNGTEIDTANPDWHWDRNFGKVEITDQVKKGENIIDFKVNYDFLTEVEPAYIIGDFGVAMADPFRGKIVAEPEKLAIGAWNDQGYPFYSGRMVYKTTVEGKQGGGTILRLVNPSGILYKVRVNGNEAGSILWRPFELDISEHVKPGSNEVEIEVVSSLQNSWGPLHEKEGDAFLWCGPNAFEDDHVLREELNSFPYGLLGGVEIVSL